MKMYKNEMIHTTESVHKNDRHRSLWCVIETITLPNGPDFQRGSDAATSVRVRLCVRVCRWPAVFQRGPCQIWYVSGPLRDVPSALNHCSNSFAIYYDSIWIRPPEERWLYTPDWLLMKSTDSGHHSSANKQTYHPLFQHTHTHTPSHASWDVTVGHFLWIFLQACTGQLVERRYNADSTKR